MTLTAPSAVRRSGRARRAGEQRAVARTAGRRRHLFRGGGGGGWSGGYSESGDGEMMKPVHGEVYHTAPTEEMFEQAVELEQEAEVGQEVSAWGQSTWGDSGGGGGGGTSEW